MPMRKCPTCEADISTEAVACPKCGHQLKSPSGINMQDPVHVIGVILAILFLLGILVYISASL